MHSIKTAWSILSYSFLQNDEKMFQLASSDRVTSAVNYTLRRTLTAVRALSSKYSPNYPCNFWMRRRIYMFVLRDVLIPADIADGTEIWNKETRNMSSSPLFPLCVLFSSPSLRGYPSTSRLLQLFSRI